MLVKNDIFLLNGIKHRLLHFQYDCDAAVVIDLEEARSWPKPIALSAIKGLEPVAISTVTQGTEVFQPTDAMLRVQATSFARLGNLHEQVPEIFDSFSRGQLIKKRAEQFGCSRSVLYRDLRRWWVGGQTRSALLGRFTKCGWQGAEKTAGRGRKPKSGRDIYQLTDIDAHRFKYAIEKIYLKDERRILRHVYNEMLGKHYLWSDGVKNFILPVGQRPTYRQFDYYFRKNYPFPVVARARKGEAEFCMKHRAVLGTVMQDCEGVGHIYEIDGSISDVVLVALGILKTLLKKVCIYVVVDRYSRLIVGFYVGLENLKWAGAAQAICSVFEDKKALCEEYGVEYCESDWPAHGLLPQEFLADRSELHTQASSVLGDKLGVEVAVLPACRPELKPVVESTFKRIRQSLQSVKGFKLPENYKKRQASKTHDKEACLTLQEYRKVFLEAVIMLNRSPMTDYPQDISSIVDGQVPTPISVWNRDIEQRRNCLRRATAEEVCFALMPSEKASVTRNGIEFKNCYYTCPEVEGLYWFEMAREKGVTQVDINYFDATADFIYVIDPKRKGKIYQCHLTERSAEFCGKSFAEIEAIFDQKKAVKDGIEQGRAQEQMEFNQRIAGTVENARARFVGAGKRKVPRTTPADERQRELEADQKRRAEKAAQQLAASQTVVEAMPSELFTLDNPQNAKLSSTFSAMRKKLKGEQI
ncbi:Mu transposase C-terminal domain-containing protein [Chitiniphilus purpureus]|uniref:Mu transposase C-terminal domain-containing protein n=1 Tax=Chitiniphilus purpureus TaxID=2981137 RepID=A0ABY6DQK6_9NEIS|nr:Mu transposase C-terminal domain-containing protein [Chitiniphilus sp. CD1]UXY16639.1 Mu transposase C-terminal domain-containing protein [Chitiniphilus sp. CD1]